jgi:hypothetical protein
MTMGSEDALEAAAAFPNATLVSAHNEGWAHLRESQDQLTDVFAQFNPASRLTRFERASRLRLVSELCEHFLVSPAEKGISISSPPQLLRLHSAGEVSGRDPTDGFSECSPAECADRTLSRAIAGAGILPFVPTSRSLCWLWNQSPCRCAPYAR